MGLIPMFYRLQLVCIYGDRNEVNDEKGRQWRRSRRAEDVWRDARDIATGIKASWEVL